MRRIASYRDCEASSARHLARNGMGARSAHAGDLNRDLLRHQHKLVSPAALTLSHAGRGPRTTRRGSVLVVAMWVVIALTGLVLSLCYSMRVEAIASANRAAQAQAESAERGMEQLLLSMVDTEVATPGSLSDISLEARQIGDCQVWVVRPDWDNSTNNDTQTYGLMDEAGKLDLNTATRDMLLNLPGMTEDVVDPIIDWRGGTSTSGLGAQDDYYLSLPTPYHCKAGKLESVEELLLVKNVTTDLLYGYDKNRNGVIDNNESSSSLASAYNSANGTGVGIFPFVTCYGTSANASPSNSSTADLNKASLQQLTTLMSSHSVSPSLAQRTFEMRGPDRGGNPSNPYANVFDWYFRLQPGQSTFTTLYPYLTTTMSSGPSSTSAVAKVNINTAAREVLTCLGFDDSTISSIISYRLANTATDPSNIAWLVSYLNATNAKTLGNYVTGRSSCFSGDIVALSPDGRAFRRYRVVISGATTPSKIVYRRDLTNSGWPLPPEIRQLIRSGQQYDAPIKGGSSK